MAKYKPKTETVMLKDDEGKKKKVTFKKDALRNQLGYSGEETIPRNVFTRIKKADVGDKLKINGKNRVVTALMKKRVNFALVLMKGSNSK